MNVDDYIAGCDDEYKRGFLARLRDLSRSAAPTAEEEGIKWGNPAYSLDTILFAFAGYAKHTTSCSPPAPKRPSPISSGDFDTGKGSIKLYYDREIPTDLLSQMIAHRIHEAEVDGVKWM